MASDNGFDDNESFENEDHDDLAERGTISFLSGLFHGEVLEVGWLQVSNCFRRNM